MMLITLRDMQWRARRIVLGLLATALVLTMTLLLDAVHDGFLDETERAVGFLDADAWVVPTGISGPFTTNTPMSTETAELLPGPGVEATPVAIFRHNLRGLEPGYTDVNVIAYAPGGVVVPDMLAGRAPLTTGEVVTDESLGASVGQTLTLAGRPLTVVGEVAGLTYNGGTPTVVVTMKEGQQVAFDGQPLASALVVRGQPTSLPDGLATMSPTQVRDDLRRPLSVATSTLGVLSLLLWVVAAGIVGFISYLSGLDRVRDFAVYKAVGVTTARVVSGVLIEAFLVALLAGVIAVGLAVLAVPAFPLSVDLDASACLRLLFVAVIIGLLAGAASVRRAVRVDPALAFANG